MSAPHPHFARGEQFAAQLKARSAAYFERTGLSPSDQPSMFAKTAVIALWLVGSYLGLYLAHTWWQILPLAISLGLAMAAVGFNIQHDGGHGAYSRRSWVNVLAAHSLDLVGGSSYVWHWKHNVTHHTYANIAHVDADTDVGPFARLTPHHAWHPPHRLQHLYIWVLYGMLPFKWIFFDDFRDLVTARIGTQPFPRPKPVRLAALLVMKVVFFVWAIAVPLSLRPWQGVVLAYVVAAVTLGLTLAVVFQLAHCVGEAEFPVAEGAAQRMENDWATHQVRTTLDFARDSKVLTWFLGGLNFQVEHHLFPRVCHVHFPALSHIVEETCAEFGVPYRAFPDVGTAIASHARWLRKMGRRPAADVAVAAS